MSKVYVQTSVGELIDKMTILEIKKELPPIVGGASQRCWRHFQSLWKSSYMAAGRQGATTLLKKKVGGDFLATLNQPLGRYLSSTGGSCGIACNTWASTIVIWYAYVSMSSNPNRVCGVSRAYSSARPPWGSCGWMHAKSGGLLGLPCTHTGTELTNQ